MPGLLPLLRVVHLQAKLKEQLLDVAVAERVAQVPGDGLDDQRRLEVPAPEVILGPALQLGSEGAEDHGGPPKSEGEGRPVCSTSGKRREFATGPTDEPIEQGRELNAWVRQMRKAAGALS